MPPQPQPTSSSRSPGFSRSFSNTSRYLFSCASSSDGIGVRVARAGVGHRRAEDPFVERVRDVVMVMDSLGIAGLAVPQAFCDAPPAGQGLLRRRRDRLEVLNADGADDVRQHPGRRPLEVHLVGERPQQLVGIGGMHAERRNVTGDIRAGQPEFPWRRGEIRGAARGQQVQPDGGVLGSGRAPVVCGELQGVLLTSGEDLQDLGECQLSRRRIRLLLFVCRHRLCTAFAYRSRRRESGSYAFLTVL